MFCNSTQRGQSLNPKSPRMFPISYSSGYLLVRLCKCVWLNLDGAVNYINSTHELDIHISMTKANTKVKSTFFLFC